MFAVMGDYEGVEDGESAGRVDDAAFSSLTLGVVNNEC